MKKYLEMRNLKNIVGKESQGRTIVLSERFKIETVENLEAGRATNYLMNGDRRNSLVPNAEFLKNADYMRIYASKVGVEFLDISKDDFKKRYFLITEQASDDAEAREAISYAIRNELYLIKNKETSLVSLLVPDPFKLNSIEINRLVFDDICFAPEHIVEIFNEEHTTFSKPIADNGEEFVRHVLEVAKAQGVPDIYFSARGRELSIRFGAEEIIKTMGVYGVADILTLRNTLPSISNAEISESSFDSKIRFGGEDYRINFWNGASGWRATIRSQDSAMYEDDSDFTSLFFPQEAIDLIEEIMLNKNGLIFVSGDTGQGKTTTMYRGVTMLAKMGLEVVTVENPVEKIIGLVDQLDLTQHHEMTVAGAIKLFLRSKPHVIMVGEVRDAEEIRMLYDAAITGHLTLTTFHATDVHSTFSRAMHGGLDKQQIEGSVRGVIYQYLERMLCSKCKIPDGEYFKASPEGCKDCNRGYKGRVPIPEIAKLSSTKPWNVDDPSTYEKHLTREVMAMSQLKAGRIDKLHYEAIIARQRVVLK